VRVLVATAAALAAVVSANPAATVALPGSVAGAVLHRAHQPDAGRHLEFLHVSHPKHGLAQIVDQHGRSVLLRGVNIDGIVDYFKPSLRTPYPIRPAAYRHHHCPRDDEHVEGVPICWFDFREMRRIGYYNIRLNVSWSLLEPKPGHIDRRYIRRIAQVVRWAKRQGIWTVIDMHQDAWSKYVFTEPKATCPPGLDRTRGYDGAPKWASQSRLPACTVDNIRELDFAVQHDAQSFWSDLDAPDGVGLQEHYAHMMAVLAKRFGNNSAVAGYDVMNEPEPGFLPDAGSSAELLPFYAKVARTIRAKVPAFRQLLFFEPGVERNTTAAPVFFTPWSAVSDYPNAVYAPHVYTKVFTLGAVTGAPDVATFDSDYDAAAGDAKALGLPLWVGEYGGPPAKDKAILAKHFAQQERRRVGGTMWLWKENANDTIANTFWGIYGPPFNGHRRFGVPQRSRVLRTSRVYPAVTAGRLVRNRSHPFHDSAIVVARSPRVRFRDRRRAALVEVPGVYDGGIEVRGARYQVRRRGGARLVWIYPRGGRYVLRVRPVRAGQSRDVMMRRWTAQPRRSKPASVAFARLSRL
jgi:endoglycosylceramidase